MPIPELNNYGLLPPGKYDCTLDEIKARFSQANHRPKREELWKLLIDYLALIRPIGIVVAVYVDGSFITDKTVPSDIDLVLEMPPPSMAVLNALMRSEFEHDHVKSLYKMDIWFWYPDAPAENDWVGFFQELKAKDLVRLHLKPDARKGILRVVL